MGERICEDGNGAVMAQSVALSWFRTKESNREPWTSHFKPDISQGKATPSRPSGFQEVKAPRLQDNRHMKMVTLSALCTDSLYPLENIPSTHFC